MASLKTIVAGVLVLLLVVGGVSAIHTVPEGHVGVEKTWGAVNGDTHPAGMTFVTPFADSVQPVEIRPRTYTMVQGEGEGEKKDADAIQAKTQDGVIAFVDISVQYHVEPSCSADFVREWNSVEQVEHRTIRPAIRSTVYDNAGSTPATDFHTESSRQKLQEDVKSELQEQFSGRCLSLNNVWVRDIEYDEDYQKSLQNVQVSKQQAEQAEYEKDRQITRAEADAEQRIIEAESKAESRLIQAEAEAESIRKVREQLSPAYNQFVFYENLDSTDTVYWFGNSSTRPQYFKEVDESKNE